jgi:phage shock protein PspC (stress-responsive transcriptional regulator)/heme/copper-type cytochrome/quinol oxidase subunit 2
MKKIININFQGRVIPIEESAYDILQQYINSLRSYFSNEEGRDEIINDIEGRIGELFGDRLKRGNIPCITDEDVNAIIASIGRPEDFEAAEGAESGNAGTYTQTAAQQQQQQNYQNNNFSRGSLFRNSDDKVLGGVCSGLANYFRIDPIIMRILFVLFLFGGFGFLLYIIMWIVVPTKSLRSNIVKRLFRNPDDKVIGGVCGGLAQYFKIDSWIPRLIFVLPFVLGIVGNWNFDFDFGPRFISGSLGSTLFLTYIILWIAVPYATTAADKLEMKGERVDLNSIRDTIKDDLGSFKNKAQSFGSEVKEAAAGLTENAKDLGSNVSNKASMFAQEAAPVARRAGSGIGNAIGILFKIFFFFIAGVVALGLFGGLIGLIFGGLTVYPLKDFILEGFNQNFLLWGTLLLFIAVPVIGLITWLIRRIMNVRSNKSYLGWIFGGLWTIGWIFATTFVASITRSFKSKTGVEEQVAIIQPIDQKLYVNATKSYVKSYDRDWYWESDLPVFGLQSDSVFLNTVRVNVVKSADSNFHIYKVKYSRANSVPKARDLANRIDFKMEQEGNTLTLAPGFAISKNDKFRNQQVLVVIEVPVGKRIEMDKSIDHYDWFNIEANRRNGLNIQWDDRWDNSYSWSNNVEYIMTPDGLKKTTDLDETELKNGKFKMRINGEDIEIDGIDGNVDIEGEINIDSTNSEYRYKRKAEEDRIRSEEDRRRSEEERIRSEEKKNELRKNIRQTIQRSVQAGIQMTSPLLTIQEGF